MDLNCGDVKSRVESYVAKTLPRGEVVAIKEHLDECAPCCVAVLTARKSMRGEIPGAMEVTQQAGLSR